MDNFLFIYKMSDIDTKIANLKIEIEEYERHVHEALLAKQPITDLTSLINGARASLTKLYELKASQGM